MGYKLKHWSKAPREFPTSSGNAQPQPDHKGNSAAIIGKAKESTGRPSGPPRTSTGLGVRFNLEEANRAKWVTPQKGIPEVE